MSEISLFSSTPEIPEDTFRALFEIIAKYSSLEAVPALVFASSSCSAFLRNPGCR